MIGTITPGSSTIARATPECRRPRTHKRTGVLLLRFFYQDVWTEGLGEWGHWSRLRVRSSSNLSAPTSLAVAAAHEDISRRPPWPGFDTAQRRSGRFIRFPADH